MRYGRATGHWSSSGSGWAHPTPAARMQPRGPGTPLAPVRARGEGAPVSHGQVRAFADSWRDTPTSDLGLRAYPMQDTNETERVRPGLEPGARARYQAVPH